MKGLRLVFPEPSLFTRSVAHADPADIRQCKYLSAISSLQNVGSDDFTNDHIVFHYHNR